MRYFNLDWVAQELGAIRDIQDRLEASDKELNFGIMALLKINVVVARGRKLSPSLPIERLVSSKRLTNTYIVDQLRESWNIVAEQSRQTSDKFDILLELINPRHRNKTGVSDTLRYQLAQLRESFLDFWVTVGDMVVGFRVANTKVFGERDVVPMFDYLHRGMTRSQLLAAFGHDLPPADENDTE